MRYLSLCRSARAVNRRDRVRRSRTSAELWGHTKSSLDHHSDIFTLATSSTTHSGSAAAPWIARTRHSSSGRRSGVRRLVHEPNPLCVLCVLIDLLCVVCGELDDSQRSGTGNRRSSTSSAGSSSVASSQHKSSQSAAATAAASSASGHAAANAGGASARAFRGGNTRVRHVASLLLSCLLECVSQRSRAPAVVWSRREQRLQARPRLRRLLQSEAVVAHLAPRHLR